MNNWLLAMRLARRELRVGLGIFNLSAGAAKGTRFMMGVGALLLPEQEFLARASSEASTSAPRTVSDVLTAARALLKKK